MANDGVKGHSTKNSFNIKDYEIYNKISKIKNNASFEEFKGISVYLKATRNIQKDEEILVAYNYGYWTCYNTNT
jgi:hypothetical protein